MSGMPKRAAVAMAVCGGVLSCAIVAGPAYADGAGPAGEGDPSLSLILNGAEGARPGEVVDLALDHIGTAPGQDTAVASSPVFRAPVRLRPEQGSPYAAREPIVMTAKPGTYPVVVKVGGKVVARDKVKVVASQRPRFEVSAMDTDVARPGERLYLAFDDLYPGETGTAFTARSKAFAAPVRLTHDDEYDWNNPRMFSAQPHLPPGTPDGVYAVTVTGGDGHRVTEAKLTVRAARSGDGDYVGKVRKLAFFGKHGYPDASRTKGYRLRSGGAVNVLLRDAYPDPGEEDRLTATSPAFAGPVKLRRDDSKAGDGDDPRYYGLAKTRRGLEPGSYPVTVVSHHGRVKRTAHLTVTKGPAHDYEDEDGGGVPGAVWAGGGAGAAALLGAAAAVLVRKRRRAANG